MNKRQLIENTNYCTNFQAMYCVRAALDVLGRAGISARIRSGGGVEIEDKVMSKLH